MKHSLLWCTQYHLPFISCCGGRGLVLSSLGLVPLWWLLFGENIFLGMECLEPLPYWLDKARSRVPFDAAPTSLRASCHEATKCEHTKSVNLRFNIQLLVYLPNGVDILDSIQHSHSSLGFSFVFANLSRFFGGRKQVLRSSLTQVL